MRRLLIIACLLLGGMALTAISPIPPGLPTVFDFDETMVAPVQPIAELTGAVLTEDLHSGEITAAYREHTFRCTPGSRIAHQDNREIALPLPVFRSARVLYIPLAPLAEALGGTLQHEAMTHQIVLRLPGAAPLAMPIRLDKKDPQELAALDHATALFVVNLDGTGFRRLTYDGEAATLPTVSHDGTKLLWKSNGRLFMRALDRPLTRMLGTVSPERDPQYTAPYFSRDDSRILYEYSETVQDRFVQQVRSMAVDGADARSIIAGSNLAVSPDGSRMCYLWQQPDGADQQLLLASVDGQNPRVLGRNLPPPIFSPDARHLTWKVEWQQFGHYMNAVMVASVTEHGIETHELLQLADYQCELHPGCFSPDSLRLVCYDRGLAIYNVTTGKRLPVLDKAVVGMPSFTPDGTHLIFVSQGHLCSIRPDGSELRVLTPSIQCDADSRWCYTFAPGGRVIIAAAPG